MSTLPIAVCFALLAGVAGTAAAAPEGKTEAKPVAAATSAPPQMMAPKPGPHHQHLAMDVGTWDATMEAFGPPGTPPMVSQAVEVNTLSGNGLWLISDYKGTFMGQPFQGHGVNGYDPAKNRYNGVWTDSLITSPLILDGTCDGTGKVRTLTAQGPTPDGGTATFTMVTDHPSPDTRTFTLSVPGPDGKPFTMMKISYKRRK
jgi:hypothetical protein